MRAPALAVAIALAAAALAAALGGCIADSDSSNIPVEDTLPKHRRGAVVWAVGDAGWESFAARRLAHIVGTPERPDRLLYLGDVYEDGTAEDFERNYEPIWGHLANITEPTPGNHDWSNRRTGYGPYWRSKKGQPYPRWSSFRIGGWEILNLNSEARHDQDSRQVRWLERKLRGRPGNCRIAFFHRPRFSAGLHGDAPHMAPLYSALRGQAKAVISGHDHDLQRLRPRGGIVQYVAGAGGHGRYPLDHDYDGLAWGRDDVVGALRIILRPRRATFEFSDAEGHLLDRSRLSCKRS